MDVIAIHATFIALSLYPCLAICTLRGVDLRPSEAVISASRVNITLTLLIRWLITCSHPRTLESP